MKNPSWLFLSKSASVVLTQKERSAGPSSRGLALTEKQVWSAVYPLLVGHTRSGSTFSTWVFPSLMIPSMGHQPGVLTEGRGGLVGKSDEELLQALVEEHRSQENFNMLDIADDCIGIAHKADKNKASEKMDKSAGTAESDKSGESCPVQVDACGSDKKLDCIEAVNDNNTVKDCQNPQPVKSHGNETGANDSSQKTPPDHLCSECKLVRPDPTEKELIMYLHALRYKGPDFEYSTQLPDWAKEDWVEAD